jgi:hypothetical protein
MSAVLLMLNNYLHDLATAFLFALGLTMFLLVKEMERRKESKDFVSAAKRIFYTLSFWAAISLFLILFLGIPRLIFFNRFELWEAAKRGIVFALIFKHLLLFALVFFGLFLWFRLRKKVQKM